MARTVAGRRGGEEGRARAAACPEKSLFASFSSEKEGALCLKITRT
jgi:hypothetical protein